MTQKKKPTHKQVTFIISDKEGFPMREASEIPVGECKDLPMEGKAKEFFGDKARVCRSETGFTIE
jgi:hypothetical protein